MRAGPAGETRRIVGIVAVVNMASEHRSRDAYLNWIRGTSARISYYSHSSRVKDPDLRVLDAGIIEPVGWTPVE